MKRFLSWLLVAALSCGTLGSTAPIVIHGPVRHAAAAAATITPVQEGGEADDNATSTSRTMASNITAGNLIVIVVHAQKASEDPFVVGDVSLSAGTATVGAWSLDVQIDENAGFFPDVAIYSNIVTGTGSATFTVGGAPASTYFNIAIGEYNSSTGWNASRLEATSTGTSTGTAVDSGNGTSAGVGLFVGGVTTDAQVVVTIAEDGAFTVIDEEEDGSAHCPASAIRRIVTSGTTDSASWTLGASHFWVAPLAVYKPI